MGSQLIDAAVAAYPTMAHMFAANWAIREAAGEGYYVASGGQVVPSGTAGKVDMGAGVDFFGTASLTVPAVTAAATTITSLAPSAGNEVIVLLEVDGTTPTTGGSLQFNAGTAAPFNSALPPTPTAGRVVHAALYIRAGATAVDANLSTANGNAKLIDLREIRAPHGPRELDAQTALTTLTNPTALASLLVSTTPVPAQAPQAGDAILLRLEGGYKNTQNASTLEIKVVFAGVTLIDYTTPSIPLDATNQRRWHLDVMIVFNVVGAAGIVEVGALWVLSPPSANTFVSSATALLAGIANADLMNGSAQITGIDTTGASNVIDVQAKIGTSSSTATMTRRAYLATYQPA